MSGPENHSFLPMETFLVKRLLILSINYIVLENKETQWKSLNSFNREGSWYFTDKTPAEVNWPVFGLLRMK